MSHSLCNRYPSLWKKRGCICYQDAAELTKVVTTSFDWTSSLKKIWKKGGGIRHWEGTVQNTLASDVDLVILGGCHVTKKTMIPFNILVFATGDQSNGNEYTVVLYSLLVRTWATGEGVRRWKSPQSIIWCSGWRSSLPASLTHWSLHVYFVHA